jgi:replication-associated recombination protein RarA
MYVNTQNDYRPKQMSEFVFADDKAEQQIDSYVNGKQTKPIILYGSYGTGKSLLASLIPKAIDGDDAHVKRYTAEDLNSKYNIRDIYFHNKQYDNLFRHGNQKFNYVLIEEMNFKPTKYSEFRLALDDVEGVDLTIITTNELEKIDDAVKSRSTMIHIKAADPLVFLPRAKQIIDAEAGKISDSKLLEALEAVSGSYKGNRAYYEVIDEILLPT